MTTGGLQHVIAELEKYPAALAAFEEGLREVERTLSPGQIVSWAELGVRIAQQKSRAWEATVEYYKASPNILQIAGPTQFERWAENGIELAEDTPVVSASYFRASPRVLPHLPPRHIANWAGLGRSLSRGTWKSSSLASRFFDISPELAERLTFQEIEHFVGLVESLSHRSYDLAAECLVLGQRVLPSVSEREELIGLATVLAETSWREVRGSFEAAIRVDSAVDKRLRPRYYALAERLARRGLTSVTSFIIETTQALSALPGEFQGTVIEHAEELADGSIDAVGAFIHAAPTVLQRISPTQMEAWYAQGLEILKENVDGGVAYFRLQSSRAEQLLEALSSSVELERVRNLLTMYTNALAGEEMELQPTQQIASKKIGWVNVEAATTDGSTIYLPPSVDQYPTKPENFAWLKVVTTHQIGHLEFGSFEFAFDKRSALFDDMRGRLAQDVDEPGATTGMARFLDLFPHRSLAADVFSIVEDARVDHDITRRYRGLAEAYRRVQGGALESRTPMELMPAQQAMVELLVRLSLGQNQNVAVPAQYLDQAREIAAVLKRIQATDANVEDTAEAAIRLYHLISQMANEPIPLEDWELADLRDVTFTDPTADEVAANLQAQREAEEEEDYEPSEDVEYRGEFKPEMVQLLTMMRQQGMEQGDEEMEAMQALTQEELEQLLRDSTELDGMEEEELTAVASNMRQEAGADQPPSANANYNTFGHQDETGGSLEPVEPRSFAYDEWDFRANDYRPRWCIVHEKQTMLGDPQFYNDTLRTYSGLMEQIRRQFEAIRPETYRKIKRLPDGEDIDLDAAIDAVIDMRSLHTPDERVYWLRNKAERDVAVAFLLDMSASTAEAVEENPREADSGAPSDPVAYTAWLRTRRNDGQRRAYKRIIDVEKETLVLMMNALDTIGDRYGVYGFSGFGRENVEFYIIKDVNEAFSDTVRRRMDKVAPLHATRMGPAIRHAAKKLERVDAKTKFLIVISDGRPQDRGYSREGVEKEYAVQDTRMALIEAKQQDITPFCLTVDRNGHDYLRAMAGDMGYEVVPDILELPRRLPNLYRRLTV